MLTVFQIDRHLIIGADTPLVTSQAKGGVSFTLSHGLSPGALR